MLLYRSQYCICTGSVKLANLVGSNENARRSIGNMYVRTCMKSKHRLHSYHIASSISVLYPYTYYSKNTSDTLITSLASYNHKINRARRLARAQCSLMHSFVCLYWQQCILTNHVIGLDMWTVAVISCMGSEWQAMSARVHIREASSGFVRPWWASTSPNHITELHQHVIQ